jgi:transcriptional regulator GlxA family with amidase domain
MQFGVFIYDGVEPVDLATFGVLSMARRVAPQIGITTIAPAAGPVTLSNGLQVLAAHGIDSPPAVDALIVTGGPGWQAQAAHAPTLAYLREAARHAVVASVCTGGMILAASGLLDGRKATTKREVVAGQEVPPIALMRERHPLVDVVEARLVDSGRIVTGGGVTLCIDATLHLLERLLGRHVADETARILEYRHARAANRAAYAEYD